MKEESALELRDSLASLLTVGLFAGLIAAGINIAYMYLYESMSGYSYKEEVNFMAVAISSIIPGIFAGLGLFMLFRFFPEKTINIFIASMIIIGLMSIIYPLVGTPEGVIDENQNKFLWLTIPMHVFASMIYLFMLLKTVRK